jgi:uncharacterized protein involved in tolerance to divalent cations
MFEATDYLFNNKLGLDLYEQYKLSSDLICQFDRDEINEYIEMYITGCEETDGDNIVLDKAMQLYSDTITSILNDFAITVTEDTDISMLNQLLIEICKIEEYEDSETILKLLSLDTSNEEKLADILSVVGIKDVSEYLECITEVDSSLLEKIKEKIQYSSFTVEDEIMSIDENQIVIKEITDKLKLIINRLDNKHLYTIEFIKSGAKIGLKFNQYLDLVFDNILENDSGFIAENLLLLASMSIDGYKDQVKVATDALNVLLPDPMDSGSIYHKLRELSIKVTRNG